MFTSESGVMGWVSGVSPPELEDQASFGAALVESPLMESVAAFHERQCC